MLAVPSVRLPALGIPSAKRPLFKKVATKNRVNDPNVLDDRRIEIREIFEIQRPLDKRIAAIVNRRAYDLKTTVGLGEGKRPSHFAVNFIGDFAINRPLGEEIVRRNAVVGE